MSLYEVLMLIKLYCNDNEPCKNRIFECIKWDNIGYDQKNIVGCFKNSAVKL